MWMLFVSYVVILCCRTRHAIAFETSLELVHTSTQYQQLLSTSQNLDYKLFKLALHFSNDNEKHNFSSIKQLHLIRVPKAGSSALSAVARRIAGCQPPGPCCYYPGSPHGSCPAVGDPPQKYALACSNIVGCVGHDPNVDKIYSPDFVSVSMMREPFGRAISAYSYYPPHTNRVGKCENSFSRECFLKFINARKYCNIVTKMFSGYPAYKLQIECTMNKSASQGQKKSSQACSVQAALESVTKLDLMGVTEMWGLSMLILYHKVPQIKPNASDFHLPSMTALQLTNESVKQAGSRQHTNADYLVFKESARDEYAVELSKQNNMDVHLYLAVLKQLCRDIHDAGYWDYKAVQQSWTQNLPSGYENSVPQCQIESRI